VVTSAEVYPLSREFERWNTAVFTAFVQQDVVTYAQGLESKLLALGLSQGHLSLFQCLGGALEPAEASAAPLQLMDSGPVGGVIAAKRLAALLGPEGNLICADMGGTSFDLALLRGGDFTYSKRRALGDPAYVTGLSSVDIVSIGAGGGSIAWSDRRGIPQVGPMSAGAVPGPACYGAGGTAPTVTDAMVVMGFIEPGQFLGGRRKLDLEAARTAVSTLGATAGWTPEQTAAGIHDIAVANMINALREVSVQKGHDPRDFTMLAYGGMTPLFAWTVAAGAGIGTVVIPPHAAAFSAWGVVLADHVRRYEQTVDWNLDDPERVHDINTTVDTLVARALADAARAGFAESEVEITRSGSFRFLGQVWEIDLPIELRRFTAQDAPALKEAFIRRYEEIYGRGTAWKGSAVVLLDYSVTATGREATPEFPPWTSGTAAPSRRDTRRVFDPSSRSQVEFAVYDEDDLGVGASLAGPAIIDGGDTTILVPIGVRGSRDARGNLVLAADDAMQERSGQVA
jgi:N-methylhydantoinase A